MVRTTFTRVLLGAALVITIPLATAAQDPAESPESDEWHLTSYTLDGEALIVPWYVDATLLLEAGQAAGSTGCNTFSGSYTLEGDQLTFDPTVTMTRMACPEEESAVEDGYMAALPLVEFWTMEDGDLLLADADGLPLLGFERSTVALTESDVVAMAALFREQQAEIQRLDERIDSVRIRILRERVKELEGQVEALSAAQAAAQRQAATTFASSERTLLQGIPSSIRSTCRPLRADNNPAGTLAAVRCRPADGLISEMAYYLMPYKQARRTFNTVMARNDVPQGNGCRSGKPGKVLTPPLFGEGCFVSGGRANVRLIDWAAGCHQLNVGGTQVAQPAIYVAIEGKNRRIAPLINSLLGEGGYTVTSPIPYGAQPLSPGCE